MSPKRIVLVVTNASHYTDPKEPTGLWLTELTNAYDLFAEKGYTQTLVSPNGGVVPLEPRSLKWPNLDPSGKAWMADESKMALLHNTKAPGDINPADIDAIYFTGGYAVMFDFPDSQPLQDLTAAGRLVASVCHGYCGLLNVKLKDGSNLIAGRKLTGFSWCEEELAGVAKKVPYNSEQQSKDRGALYQKAWVPFVSYAVVDGKLVTGQTPQSAKETAKRVVEVLEDPSK